MRQIATQLKQQLPDSITFRVLLVIGLLTLVVSVPWPRSAARQNGFQRGDVFASLDNGRVLRFSQTTGALLQTLDTATGSFITGSAFDRDANLYVTAFASRAIVKFDNQGNRVGNFGNGFNGRPESILFDPDGNAFVGTVDGDNDVRKFDRNGNALDTFDVPFERRGADWIELAADRCTLFYTSEGNRILRYDLCTKTPLPDFVSNLPHSAAYALRLLPSGGLIVADTNEILRLDTSGNIIQRYDAPGEDSWFAINLDPDGTSFWSGGISTGNAYKFDIATGNQLTRITTGASAIYGLSILGEITVVNPTPSPTVSPTATPICGDVLLSVTGGEVRRYTTSGNLVQTLNTGLGADPAGMAFDKDNNLYVTTFAGRTVIKFNAQGQRLGAFGSGYTGFPESVVIDRAGNVYVGQATGLIRVEGDNHILKFNADGSFAARYNVQTEDRGSDWIELAPDQCTMFYTSEGKMVKRFDVCTNTQLSDYAVNLPGSRAYALRLLPSARFPAGELIVADTEEIVRVNSSGAVIQRYDAPGEDSWFAINLDPDGRSFWSAGIFSGNAYKFDIATGQILSSFNSRTPPNEGGEIVGGLAVICEIVAGGPNPQPGQADLAITKTANPTLVNNGTVVEYTLTVTNNGPSAASAVTVTDQLPGNTSLVACAAGNGGTCQQSNGSRIIITQPTLAAGASVVSRYSVQVSCPGIQSTVLTNTATVTSSNADPNTSNNTAVASVTVAPPQPRITIERSPSVLDFGEVPLRREGLANPPSYLITVENTGCLPLTVGFNVKRTGSEVDSGRISDPDDRPTFPIALVNGSQTFLNNDEIITLQGGARSNFRIFFNPKIPAAAGKISGLSASQAIPDVINSLLTILTNAPGDDGNPRNFNYPLVGRVSNEVRLINPTAPSLAPLVVIARNGDIFTVEFSVHDANMDFFCAVYQFLNVANVPVGDAPVFYFGEDIAKANLVRGQSFSVVKQFTGANRRPEAVKVKVTVFDNLNNSVEFSGAIGSQQGRVVNVSAASFAASSLAPQAIVAAFGSRLATTTRAATTAPLPVELAGTRVSVTDSRNVERAAPLFFVAPGQINYMVPAGTAPGPAVVTVAAGDGSISVGNVEIASVAPALFTATSTGQGVAAGVALRVRSNGTQVFEPIARYDAPTQRFVPVAIDVRNSSEQVFLVLFGSGIRHHRSPQAATITVGGGATPIIYLGPQGSLVGLDQVNLRLPPTLAGRGEVEVRLNVDGKAANPVRVQIR